MSKKKKIYLVFKRFNDIVFSSILVLVFSPFFVIIALFIKATSKGPIFFIQWRVGKNKKPFKILKFRTMQKDAPEIPSTFLSIQDQLKMSTRFGIFLRKTSIDELPQIFNILLGQMSFVGPRPGALHNEEYLIIERDKYDPSPFSVLPGLTGYAQTHGRRIDSQTKARLDYYYILHLSIWLDLKIILLTIKKLLLFEGS